MHNREAGTGAFLRRSSRKGGAQTVPCLPRERKSFLPSRLRIYKGDELHAVGFEWTESGQNGAALCHSCCSSPVVLPLLLPQHTTNTCATERLGKGMLCYSAPPFNTRLLQMQARTNDERHNNRYCGQDHGDKL